MIPILIFSAAMLLVGIWFLLSLYIIFALFKSGFFSFIVWFVIILYCLASGGVLFTLFQTIRTTDLLPFNF